MTQSGSSSQTQVLGEFRKSFFPRALLGKVLLGSAIFCVIFGILEFVSAINKDFSPPSSILSEKFRQDSITMGVILGVVFVMLSLCLAGLYYAHRKHRVDLYTDGVVVATCCGEKTVPWGDLMKVDKIPVYGRSRRPVNWTYTLHRFDGEKVDIRGLDGLSVLGRIIEKHDA